MKKLILVTLALTFLTPKASGQSFEFPAECERMFRNHRGTLVITPDGIEYRTSRKNESRSWRYTDIQQIKIESPTELEILTYEDQRRMLGRDRIFRFRLLEGKITPALSALLVAKAARPVVTSVAPAPNGEPRFETAVKHLHAFGGCEGALKIYPDRVAFESTNTGAHSRYWRYSDIQGLGHPSRYRFEITTFEDKFGGPAKVYDFQLKEDLPAPAYDYVWVRVNPAELYPYGNAAREDALAATPPGGQEGRPRPEGHSLNPEPVTAPAAEAAAPRAKQNDSEVRTVAQEKKDSPPAVAGGAPEREENQVGKEETQAIAAEAKTREESRVRSEKTKVQTARVVLTEQGYKPDSIRLLQGIPARITFLRQAEGSCGTEIVLPELGVKRALPLNKPVVVAFTPNKSGEFSFTCGMGMLRGKIVVEEK
jgi:hypothetical protein